MDALKIHLGTKVMGWQYREPHFWDDEGDLVGHLQDWYPVDTWTHLFEVILALASQYVISIHVHHGNHVEASIRSITGEGGPAWQGKGQFEDPDDAVEMIALGIGEVTGFNAGGTNGAI